MTAIQRLLAALTSHSPKAESLTVECPECSHSFEVEDWRTAAEARSSTSSEDDEDGDDDDDDEFEDKNSMSPKNRAAREADLSKSLLNVAKDRASVNAQHNAPSVKQATEFVKKHAKNVKRSDADVLADALKKAAGESRR